MENPKLKLMEKKPQAGKKTKRSTARHVLLKTLKCAQKKMAASASKAMPKCSIHFVIPRGKILQSQRGAFTDTISRDDVVFLINHAGLPLARTHSGTLQLSEDANDLKVRAFLDASDPDVCSIIPKMKRGDLDKMSFAFVPTRQS